MKKSLIALYFLLTASLPCGVIYADDNSSNSNFLKDSCYDGYCPRISFINFPSNQVSLLTVTEKFSDYKDNKPGVDINATLTYHDEKIINNDEQFMDIYNGFFVDTPLNMRRSDTIYDDSVKNFFLQINSINGVNVDNCIIEKETITAPSSNDKIVVTRVDDQRYTCVVTSL